MAIKTALITGSEGGIGQVLCKAFKDAHYKVIGLDVHTGNSCCDDFIKADLREICQDEESRLTRISDIRKMLKNRRLDVLVNNAAVQILKNAENLTPEDWYSTLDVNVIAPFLLAQGFLKELEKAKGSVVNIGSIHAFLTKPEFICYATSKAALEGLTRSMAVEFGARIRVNVINPAATATPMLMAGFQGEKEESLKELSGMHPLGRIAEPEEIAHVAVFLASPQASFITGVCLNVDGGIGSRLHDPE
jgi:NAD(P)-dependent dehydrogenase (short-subunit alcohol dehydrogenase family)